MFISVKGFMLLFLMLLPHLLFSETVEKLYKTLVIYPDWTLEGENSVQEDIKGKEPYFLIKQEGDFITSVEYFDSRNKPAHFMLDPTYQLYFSKAVLSYIPGKKKPAKRLNKMFLTDFMGLPTGYIQYKWDNKSIMGRDGNVRNSFLYTYSHSYPKGFFAKERRYFMFGGGAFDRNIGDVEHFNQASKLLFAYQYYEGGKLVKNEYFDIYNQKLYTEYYNYSWGKLKTKVIYSKNGVKLREINMED